MRTNLTFAEREVARLIMLGHSNAEIARTRRCSPKTVANQVATIFQKLGADSRVAVAAKLAGTCADQEIVPGATEAGSAGDDARAQLRALAVGCDQKRWRLRSRDHHLAALLLSELVSGRWSLLDHFATPQRHFLILCDSADAPKPLEPRETAVLRAVALGWSGKRVGYELGLSRSVVSRVLASSLRKLGLESPAELACALGPFVAQLESGSVGQLISGLARI